METPGIADLTEGFLSVAHAAAGARHAGFSQDGEAALARLAAEAAAAVHSHPERGSMEERIATARTAMTRLVDDGLSRRADAGAAALLRPLLDAPDLEEARRLACPYWPFCP